MPPTAAKGPSRPQSSKICVNDGVSRDPSYGAIRSGHAPSANFSHSSIAQTAHLHQSSASSDGLLTRNPVAPPPTFLLPNHLGLNSSFPAHYDTPHSNSQSTSSQNHPAIQSPYSHHPSPPNLDITPPNNEYGLIKPISASSSSSAIQNSALSSYSFLSMSALPPAPPSGLVRCDIDFNTLSTTVQTLWQAVSALQRAYTQLQVQQMERSKYWDIEYTQMKNAAIGLEARCKSNRIILTDMDEYVKRHNKAITQDIIPQLTTYNAQIETLQQVSQTQQQQLTQMEGNITENNDRVGKMDVVSQSTNKLAESTQLKIQSLEHNFGKMVEKVEHLLPERLDMVHKEVQMTQKSHENILRKLSFFENRVSMLEETFGYEVDAISSPSHTPPSSPSSSSSSSILTPTPTSTSTSITSSSQMVYSGLQNPSSLPEDNILLSQDENMYTVDDNNNNQLSAQHNLDSIPFTSSPSPPLSSSSTSISTYISDTLTASTLTTQTSPTLLLRTTRPMHTLFSASASTSPSLPHSTSTTKPIAVAPAAVMNTNTGTDPCTTTTSPHISRPIHNTPPRPATSSPSPRSQNPGFSQIRTKSGLAGQISQLSSQQEQFQRTMDALSSRCALIERSQTQVKALMTQRVAEVNAVAQDAFTHARLARDDIHTLGSDVKLIQQLENKVNTIEDRYISYNIVLDQQANKLNALKTDIQLQYQEEMRELRVLIRDLQHNKADIAAAHITQHTIHKLYSYLNKYNVYQRGLVQHIIKTLRKFGYWDDLDTHTFREADSQWKQWRQEQFGWLPEGEGTEGGWDTATLLHKLLKSQNQAALEHMDNAKSGISEDGENSGKKILDSSRRKSQNNSSPNKTQALVPDRGSSETTCEKTKSGISAGAFGKKGVLWDRKKRSDENSEMHHVFPSCSCVCDYDLTKNVRLSLSELQEILGKNEKPEKTKMPGEVVNSGYVFGGGREASYPVATAGILRLHQRAHVDTAASTSTSMGVGLSMNDVNIDNANSLMENGQSDRLSAGGGGNGLGVVSPSMRMDEEEEKKEEEKREVECGDIDEETMIGWSKQQEEEKRDDDDAGHGDGDSDNDDGNEHDNDLGSAAGSDVANDEVNKRSKTQIAKRKDEQNEEMKRKHSVTTTLGLATTTPTNTPPTDTMTSSIPAAMATYSHELVSTTLLPSFIDLISLPACSGCGCVSLSLLQSVLVKSLFPLYTYISEISHGNSSAFGQMGEKERKILGDREKRTSPTKIRHKNPEDGLYYDESFEINANTCAMTTSSLPDSTSHCSPPYTFKPLRSRPSTAAYVVSNRQNKPVPGLHAVEHERPSARQRHKMSIEDSGNIRKEHLGKKPGWSEFSGNVISHRGDADTSIVNIDHTTPGKKNTPHRRRPHTAQPHRELKAQNPEHKDLDLKISGEGDSLDLYTHYVDKSFKLQRPEPNTSTGTGASRGGHHLTKTSSLHATSPPSINTPGSGISGNIQNRYFSQALVPKQLVRLNDLSTTIISTCATPPDTHTRHHTRRDTHGNNSGHRSGNTGGGGAEGVSIHSDGTGIDNNSIENNAGAGNIVDSYTESSTVQFPAEILPEIENFGKAMSGKQNDYFFLGGGTGLRSTRMSSPNGTIHSLITGMSNSNSKKNSSKDYSNYSPYMYEKKLTTIGSVHNNAEIMAKKRPVSVFSPSRVRDTPVYTSIEQGIPVVNYMHATHPRANPDSCTHTTSDAQVATGIIEEDVDESKANTGTGMGMSMGIMRGEKR